MAQSDARRVENDLPVTADEASSGTEIWANFPGFSNSKFAHEYLNRLVAGRDMHVIVTASAETGVGKTTLAFAIAVLFDQNGWTAEKATLDPREYQMLYDEVRPGSVLILDEVQQAVDARRGGAHDNVNLSQAFARKRYRQVFGVMTAPSKGWVDGRIGEDSADYWIQAQETDEGKPKGEANVYRLRNNEHYEQSYTKKTETISWPVLDSHPEFKRLDEKKKERDRQGTRTEYYHRKEVDEMVEDAREEGEIETENRLTRNMYEWERERDGVTLSQADIGDIVGVHQGTVSRRLDRMGVKDGA